MKALVLDQQSNSISRVGFCDWGKVIIAFIRQIYLKKSGITDEQMLIQFDSSLFIYLFSTFELFEASLNVRSLISNFNFRVSIWSFLTKNWINLNKLQTIDKYCFRNIDCYLSASQNQMLSNIKPNLSSHRTWKWEFPNFGVTAASA